MNAGLTSRREAAKALGITPQRLGQLARAGRAVIVGGLVDLEATRRVVGGNTARRDEVAGEIEQRRRAGEPMMPLKAELFADAVARHSDLAAAARFAFVPTAATRERLAERALVLLAFPAVLARLGELGVPRERVKALHGRAVLAGYAQRDLARAEPPSLAELATPPPLDELEDVARLALDNAQPDALRLVALRALTAGLAEYARRAGRSAVGVSLHVKAGGESG